MHTRHGTHQQVDKSDDAVQHSYVARRDGGRAQNAMPGRWWWTLALMWSRAQGRSVIGGEVDANCHSPQTPVFCGKKNMNVLLHASFTANVAFFLPNLIQEQVCCVCRFLLQGMVLPSMSTYSCPVRECWFMSKYSEAKQTIVKTK